ncbi:MAG TPA: flavodoxin domain-containing protein [Anaerolineales bacterium]|jgi:menaquinone-dependent protoporphyrinogen oxidase
MNEPTKRILVTYASRNGSTARVAEAIGICLASNGAKVDVLPMVAVINLNSYRAVVAGSAIHGSNWLPEALVFIRKNQPLLAEMPFAIFTVSITMGMTNAEDLRSEVTSWVQPVRELVKPFSEGHFAGKLDLSKQPANLETLKLRTMVALGVFPNDDRRDWVAIRNWADGLKSGLEL